MMKKMKRWIFIGAVAALVLGGGVFPSVSLAESLPQVNDPSLSVGQERLPDYHKILNEQVVLQLEAAIREILQIEPAYRVAQAEVKEATRQIRPFLPLMLEASEPFDPKIGNLVAILGMKKVPMKENVSNLRFEMKTFTLKMSNLEPVLEPKRFFMVLRE